MDIEASPEENYEPVIRFDAPEDILIEVIPCPSSKWGGMKIEWCGVLNGPDDCTGAAGFAISYYGLFEYVLEDLIDPPERAGWYVVTGMTGHFSRGDGWTTDDDTEYYFESVRPALPEEYQ